MPCPTPDVLTLLPTGRAVWLVGTTAGLARLTPAAPAGQRVQQLPLPAWWRNRLCVGLARDAQGRVWLTGLLYTLHRLRLAQVLAVEQLRVGIARDLHDDIGSTLSAIAILAQVARADAEPATALTQIGESARQTLASMDDIVWAINPAHDAPRDLTSRLRAHAASVLEPMGLTLRFTAVPPPTTLKVPMRVRREVFLLFKELLQNVLKYADARTVSIDLAYTGRHLTLHLADDGNGFDPTAPPRGGGNGLPNAQARVRNLRGQLRLETAPGQGTRWELTVPL